MAHEFIDEVTATPTGPIVVSLGGTVDITASFTLNGANPGSPTFSLYSLAWTYPDGLVSFANESPAVHDTNYTHTVPLSILAAVGTYDIVIQGTYFSDAAPPDNAQSVDSNTVTIRVLGVTEEQSPSTPFTEVQASVTVTAEEQQPSGSFSEMQASSTTTSEEQAPNTTTTEA